MAMLNFDAANYPTLQEQVPSPVNQYANEPPGYEFGVKWPDDCKLLVAQRASYMQDSSMGLLDTVEKVIAFWNMMSQPITTPQKPQHKNSPVVTPERMALKSAIAQANEEWRAAVRERQEALQVLDAKVAVARDKLRALKNA